MSDIKKSERRESKLQTVHNAYKIRTAVTKLAENNFYFDLNKINEDDFKGKLSKVTIEGKQDGNKVKEIHEHMELVQIVKYDDGYYFILRDLSEEELRTQKIQGDIEYIAMMSDIDLEEGV